MLKTLCQLCSQEVLRVLKKRPVIAALRQRQYRPRPTYDCDVRMTGKLPALRIANSGEFAGDTVLEPTRGGGVRGGLV
jgi:hypothetical protein